MMLLDNEALFRLTVFAALFASMALLETLFPRRARQYDRLVRWPGNLVVTMLNTIFVRLLFPTAAVGFALSMESAGIGIMNQLSAGGPVAIVVGIVLLDLAIYVQHVVFHKVPLLWRLHRMHHTDNDIDVTSGARFHPFEIVLSMLIKLGVIWVLGPPAVAVLLFEVLLNAGSMFNHANLRLPLGFDRMLRKLIVTPDMHRVHHSAVRNETESNYGFCLSFWDRIFGTYTDQPAAGHEGMTIGLSDTQSMDAQRIDRMLADPFRNQISR
jgi:sterol desaturase/sphingolipid hydroxylase (fatty acid hydroxylase superfamily)